MHVLGLGELVLTFGAYSILCVCVVHGGEQLMVVYKMRGVVRVVEQFSRARMLSQH